VTLGVQVNGKLRGDVPDRARRSRGRGARKGHGRADVAKYLEGKTVRKVIVVAGKIVNIVVS